MALIIGGDDDLVCAEYPRVETAGSFDLQIARGRMPGWRSIFISSINQAIGTTVEDMWEVGGTQVPPTVAGVVTITSTSAADTALGTGARAILCQGLDDDYNEVSDIIPTNGLGGGVGVVEFLRMPTMTCVAAGSGEENAGTITATIGINPQSAMVAGDCASFNSHYTVPAGHRLYLKSVNFFQGEDKTITTSFKARPEGLPWITLSKLSIYRVAAEVVPIIIPVEEKTDIKITALNDGGGTSSFAVIINYFLEKVS